MPIDRYAILKNNIVTHVVMWDGDTSKWYPSAPFDAVLDNGTAVIGASYVNGAFVPAPTVESLVPASVPPLQMRKALRQLGLKETVDGFVASLDEETVEAWEYATAVERHNPLILAAAAGLGLTEEQTDELFKLAATL